ncbi:T9SS type A sorting domain-containing protein [Winogradskyella bathintestinalis]|uniref:T9SS type A sorting domain-containing protein n=1 Tax=Winogradskyella bathintestinalis TaxID=3035208 RepID=A0ABT7ZSL0_9FLAO|nr:T9SS type A sorting domain-containing protein [Winogradskyella bathintestinalis]MDN3491977.1 T9SS type A sorting domain-containing protein [Winogradskyella bathintestinalis]
MIKNYAIGLMLLLTGGVFSQETISFETSESYTLGTLNNQNGWEVTEGDDGFIQNQVISDEEATDGTYSFKNSYESSFGAQFAPIFGAAKNFDSPKPFEDFTFSYDVLVTEINGADFEMTLFGIDADDNFVPVAGIAMEYQGLIYTIDDIGYTAAYIEDATWTPNTWLNIKIEVTATELKYYLNDVLAHTRSNFTSVDIVGFNMLHNNYGGDAFYDNFSYENGTLGVNDFANASALHIYPNPVADELQIKGIQNEQIAQLSVYNLNGQQLIESTSVDALDVSNLVTGVYMLNVVTNDGKTHTEKLLKK